MILLSLLTDRKYFWKVASLVIIGDALLTSLIVNFVPYTEIDWETYMIHIQLYLKGERNYGNITGPTGPLVYPAGHVYIHQLLYAVTSQGSNIPLAQYIYGALYLVTLVLSCKIYHQAGAPNWLLLLLPLSKRIHSIYALRLFNDCWAVVLMQASVLGFQAGMDGVGVLFFSLALSVKMSILLYLPGILVILFLRRGLYEVPRRLASIIGLQVLLAGRFLREDSAAYIQNAFDLSRVFLYKWTVNWRFVPEHVFLSAAWAKGLLVVHLSLLVVFATTRWCTVHGGVWQVVSRGLRQPNEPTARRPISANYVTTVLFTSNLIGVVCARSLHYQFYAWYAQQIPFLAWKTGYPIPLQLALLIASEYAWNVFPSTTISSAVLMVANLVLLVGLWLPNKNPQGQKGRAGVKR